MNDLFRSQRLVYRAYESPEDDNFSWQIAQDIESAVNSNPRLPKPPDKKEIEESRKAYSGKSLLGVIICIAPASAGSVSPEGGTSTEIPIPIGRIALDAGFISQVAFARHRSSKIGLEILAKYQNKGYGSEAIRWILDWGFRIAGLHRIGIGCFSWNDGARRLYERLGFVPEGRQREALWHDGGWHDIIEFSMLEDEWKALK
ncbi:hypothetical protein MMC26_000976, partial [Xylographa opegraphella]|nr:hypothetical protein [Xylographa opegraphella]